MRQTPDLVAKCLVGYLHSHDLLRRIHGIDLPIVRHTGLQRHVTIERLDGYTMNEVIHFAYSPEPGLGKARAGFFYS